MSRSKRDRVLSMSSGVVPFGVGLNFRPRPRGRLDDFGRMLPVVRLWKVRFVTSVKYSAVVIDPNTF